MWSRAAGGQAGLAGALRVSRRLRRTLGSWHSRARRTSPRPSTAAPLARVTRFAPRRALATPSPCSSSPRAALLANPLAAPLAAPLDLPAPRPLDSRAPYESRAPQYEPENEIGTCFFVDISHARAPGALLGRRLLLGQIGSCGEEIHAEKPEGGPGSAGVQWQKPPRPREALELANEE